MIINSYLYVFKSDDGTYEAYSNSNTLFEVWPSLAYTTQSCSYFGEGWCKLMGKLMPRGPVWDWQYSNTSISFWGVSINRFPIWINCINLVYLHKPRVDILYDFSVACCHIDCSPYVYIKEWTIQYDVNTRLKRFLSEAPRIWTHGYDQKPLEAVLRKIYWIIHNLIDIVLKLKPFCNTVAVMFDKHDKHLNLI
jgi:hypothetical protein